MATDVDSDVTVTVARVNGTTALEWNSAESHDGFGLFLDEVGLQGWDSGPAMSGFSESRPSAPGLVQGRFHMGGRPVTISSDLEERTQADFDVRALEISGFLAEGDLARITVAKPGQTLWAIGALRRVEIEPTGYEPDGKVSMEFLCADPRRYGEEHTVPVPATGLADVPNWGTLNAWPTMTVTATANAPGGYALRLRDQSGASIGYWRIQAPLTLGQTHVLDFARAQVRRSGALQWGAVHSGSPWLIPRSRVSQVQFEYPGVGACSGVLKYADPFG